MTILVVMNLILIHLAVWLYLMIETAEVWESYKDSILANGWSMADAYPLLWPTPVLYLAPFKNIVWERGNIALMVALANTKYVARERVECRYTVGPFIFSSVLIPGDSDN